jgi:cytochrome c biogenesis protein CcmG, thiol:disulfide interchange protein DsbE
MPKTATRKRAQQTNPRSTLLWVVGGVLGLALIVWLAISIAGETDIDPSVAFGDVTVEGQPLPFLADPTTADPALGFSVPTVTGTDFDGNSHTVGPDGRPKILIFLAHWCPHCQAEVPEVQAWIDQGGLPAEVDMYSFTVLTEHVRPNWPPEEWLEEEGWTPPVIMDDEEQSVVTAYGMRGTPFYVVLDGENNNLGRFSGQVGVPGLEAMVRIAQDSIEG